MFNKNIISLSYSFHFLYKLFGYSCYTITKTNQGYKVTIKKFDVFYLIFYIVLCSIFSVLELFYKVNRSGDVENYKEFILIYVAMRGSVLFMLISNSIFGVKNRNLKLKILKRFTDLQKELNINIEKLTKYMLRILFMFSLNTILLIILIHFTPSSSYVTSIITAIAFIAPTILEHDFIFCLNVLRAFFKEINLVLFKYNINNTARIKLNDFNKFMFKIMKLNSELYEISNLTNRFINNIIMRLLTTFLNLVCNAFWCTVMLKDFGTEFRIFEFSVFIFWFFYILLWHVNLLQGINRVIFNCEKIKYEVRDI